jgi:hypothetical protein
MLLDEPVVLLLTILIVVLTLGQVSLNMFSLPTTTMVVREGATSGDAQSQTSQSKMNLVNANQSSINTLFGGLQNRCNDIKKRIDDINQKIPRTVADIQVKSVVYVPWENKESSSIQIVKNPYQFTPAIPSSMDCSCNYGCKWDIFLTLPTGPKGNRGPQGPQGPPGNAGDVGLQGPQGPRGRWQ